MPFIQVEIGICPIKWKEQRALSSDPDLHLRSSLAGGSPLTHLSFPRDGGETRCLTAL